MYDQKTLAQLHKGYLAGQGIDPNGPQPQAPGPPPPTRRGITKFLPMIGGAAAGIAAAPFTGGLSLAGTLAALGTAGAVGTAAGEFSAQKAAHEHTNIGAVAKQAAIGGALSAIPIGGVGRAAKVASQAEGDVATTAAAGVTGKIANAGRRLETRAGGFGIGEKMAGKAPVNIQSQGNIQSTLRSEGIRAGHPEDQAIKTQNKLQAYHEQMNQALTKNNVPLSKPQINQIAKGYLSKINTSATVDTTVRKAANEFAQNLKNVKDLKGLNNFRREIDQKAISYISNPDAATAAKTQAAQTLRSHLADTISKAAPAVKTVNGKYAKLATANDYLTQQAGRLTRQSENAGGGIVGRLLTGDAAQSAKSKAGAILQKVPTGAADAAPSTAKTAVTEFAKQGYGQPLASALLGANQPPSGQPLGELGPPPQPGGEQIPGGPGDGQPQSSPYSLEQALSDIQRDPKHASTYLDIYKTVDGATSSKTKPLGSTQQQQVNNANSGLRALATMQNELQSNPGVLSRSAIPGQTLPVVGGYITNAANAGTFEAARNEASDIISRLRTGAAINKEEEQFYKSQLPRAGDSNSTIKYKLNLFNQLFNSFATPQNSGGSQADLTNALLQTQGAY